MKKNIVLIILLVVLAIGVPVGIVVGGNLNKKNTSSVQPKTEETTQSVDPNDLLQGALDELTEMQLSSKTFHKNRANKLLRDIAVANANNEDTTELSEQLTKSTDIIDNIDSAIIGNVSNDAKMHLIGLLTSKIKDVEFNQTFIFDGSGEDDSDTGFQYSLKSFDNNTFKMYTYEGDQDNNNAYLTYVKYTVAEYQFVNNKIAKYKQTVSTYYKSLDHEDVLYLHEVENSSIDFNSKIGCYISIYYSDAQYFEYDYEHDEYHDLSSENTSKLSTFISLYNAHELTDENLPTSDYGPFVKENVYNFDTNNIVVADDSIHVESMNDIEGLYDICDKINVLTSDETNVFNLDEAIEIKYTEEEMQEIMNNYTALSSSTLLLNIKQFEYLLVDGEYELSEYYQYVFYDEYYQMCQDQLTYDRVNTIISTLQTYLVEYDEYQELLNAGTAPEQHNEAFDKTTIVWNTTHDYTYTTFVNTIKQNLEAISSEDWIPQHIDPLMGQLVGSYLDATPQGEEDTFFFDEEARHLDFVGYVPNFAQIYTEGEISGYVLGFNNTAYGASPSVDVVIFLNANDELTNLTMMYNEN